MNGADIIAIVILAAIVIAISVYLLHWLYRHSSKDLSVVRTGMGGERVVMGGGALVLPIVHDITEVSMNTLRIDVRRAGERSAVTSADGSAGWGDAPKVLDYASGAES